MSQEIQEQLHKQQEVIADKQMSVKEDLDKVEPAVIEAQNGVCTPSEAWPRGWGTAQPSQVPAVSVSKSVLATSPEVFPDTPDCPRLLKLGCVVRPVS